MSEDWKDDPLLRDVLVSLSMGPDELRRRAWELADTGGKKTYAPDPKPVSKPKKGKRGK